LQPKSTIFAPVHPAKCDGRRFSFEFNPAQALVGPIIDRHEGAFGQVRVFQRLLAFRIPTLG
jgi:hypothetical protein